MSLRRYLSRIALFAIGANIASSWYPFQLDPPAHHRNSAIRAADGSFRLDSHSLVHSETPEWLDQIHRLSRITIAFESTEGPSEWSGPVRLFSIGEDPYLANLTLGLDKGDFVIRFRRPESSPWGSPDWRYSIDDPTGSTVSISKDGPGQYSIEIDFARLLVEQEVPESWHSTWSLKAPLCLGNVATGHRPFDGTIHRLDICLDPEDDTSDSIENIDVLSETPWSIPNSFWVWPERLYKDPGSDRMEAIAALWHILAFLPLGWIRFRGKRVRRLGKIVLFASLVSGILTLGKLFVLGRHPSLFDAIIQVVGALLGWSLLSLFSRTARGSKALRKRLGDSMTGSRPPSTVIRD